MPYTISHMAAILPLRRKSWLRLEIALMGACIPDIGYFISWPSSLSFISHEFTGALMLGIPMTFLLFYILSFFRVELNALFCWGENHFKHPNTLRAFALALLSATIGIWSHVVWDGFTHPNGWAVELFPQLRMYVAPMPLYSWLQYISSFIGMSCVLILLNWSGLKKVRKSWERIFLTTLVLFALEFYLFHKLERELRVLLVDIFITVTRSFFLVVLCWCSIKKRFRASRVSAAEVARIPRPTIDSF
jgi:hypothetical protein